MAYSITNACIGCLACKKICPSNAITGEKKELHTINADKCIECGACGRVCPKSAVKDNFGMTVLKIKKKDWEQPVIDMEICTSCNICIDTCPVEALEPVLLQKKNPHPFPALSDKSMCIGCGFCADDCPVSAISMSPRHEKKEVQKKG